VAALGLINKTSLIWNWKTGQVIETLNGNFFDNANGLKFLGTGGSLLAAPSIHNLIHIWNLNNSIVELTLNSNAYCFESLVNGYLASASLNATIDIWNLQTGRLVRSIETNTSQIYLKQTNTSNYLVGSNINGNISIWNTNNYTLVGKLTGHTKAITDMAIMGRGSLVTVSEDNWIILWDIGSQSILNKFNPFNGAILSVERVDDDTIAVGGLSDVVFIIQIDMLNQFNVINETHVSEANVIGLQRTCENILLIAMSGGNISYFDLNTFKIEQTWSFETGLIALEMICNKRIF
jgi:WD40 repeat protein